MILLLENENLFELMEKMYAEMQGIKKDVKGNSNKIDNLEKIVLRMEQNHGQKLEALFDGYIQNTQKIDKIERKVSKQEEVIYR